MWVSLYDYLNVCRAYGIGLRIALRRHVWMTHQLI